MHLTHLRVQNLRIFADLELELAPGWNFFVGPNGAGKTSVLEAAYLLSHGQSFRRGSRDSLTRFATQGFTVFGRLETGAGILRSVAIGRSEGRTVARIDGDPASLGDLVRSCAVVCFEPGSHELISGKADERRHFLDWGVFHVEPTFLSHWRWYQRALRQRNAVLRSPGQGDALAPWDQEMVESGIALTAMRRAYLEKLQPGLGELLQTLLGELGDGLLDFDQGWKEGQGLAEALQANRQRDQERGHSTRGPHRADWALRFAQAPRREHLSRGQEKLCALALVLAQARLHSELLGEWPILCLDDLASELDQPHQEAVLRVAAESGAQVLLTGTRLPDRAPQDMRVFHVEHGRIRS